MVSHLFIIINNVKEREKERGEGERGEFESVFKYPGYCIVVR